MKENIKNPDPSTDHKNALSYKFFYWGPLLFKTKLQSKDLKECVKMCNKESSPVNETLVGVIKHEHYISTHQYYKVVEPYLGVFKHCYRGWYGEDLSQKIRVVMAWVNFMVAGEFNPPHVHKHCDFSSVLFVKVPDELKEEHKNFKGRGGGPGSLAFSYGESLSHSINHMYFFPEEGDFFIFPSTLTHFVAPFLSKGERISMSANFKLE